MKTIKDMIEVWSGDIIDAPAELGAEAVVNAANPTLMGSGENVDGAIHSKIDEISGTPDYFDRKIKGQMDHNENAENKKIRCRRGEVIRTSGYGLCLAVFHTVGPDSDTRACRPKVCSSSVMETLEKCYRNIIKETLKSKDITKIAIPIISSGNYEIDFSMAFRTALATVYNTLLDIKRKDSELFEYVALEKVYFVILKNDGEKFRIAKKIVEEYDTCFRQEVKVVSKNSRQSQKEFYKQVKLYDYRKGYFSIARCFRLLLILVREYIFPVVSLIKDRIGKNNWIKRRRIVEIMTFCKMLLPVGMYVVVKYCPHPFVLGGAALFMVYCLLDTVTYLISLIVMADIQKPSANTIRSMIMLCINYIETSMELSVIYYCVYHKKIMFREAMAFGILAERAMDGQLCQWYDYWIVYLNEGVKFFFLTLAFGYFSNHLRPRKFLDEKENE